MPVIVYAGNAGDRNERGAPGALALGEAIAADLGVPIASAGSPMPLVSGGWQDQLDAARANLHRLADAAARCLQDGAAPIITMGRCAAGLATLPKIASRHPDAMIVWFDAHGDCNVPMAGEAGKSAYLGGMVITGAAGEWDTGLGAGLQMANVVLVGSRDLDPPELARINAGEIALVPIGPELPARLDDLVTGRRVYIHLDCDALSPGLVATEYQVANGLTFAGLHEAFEVLSAVELVGLEIAEFEDSWPDGRPNPPEALVAAIRPVTRKLAG